jgi:hypothetical protein
MNEPLMFAKFPAFLDFSLSCKDLSGLRVNCKTLAPVYVPRFPLAVVDPRRTHAKHTSKVYLTTT